MTAAVCGGCGADLGDAARTSIAFEVMGDVHTDIYLECGACGAFMRESWRDRFVGEESRTLHGPIDAAAGAVEVALIGTCPDPSSSRCRCAAHRQAAGPWSG